MNFDAQGNLIRGSHEASISRARLGIVDPEPDPQEFHQAGVPPMQGMTANLIEPAEEFGRGGGQVIPKHNVWPMGQRPPKEKPQKKER